MSILRKAKRTIARVTGIEAAFERRLEAATAKLQAGYEYQARQARVQSRRARGAEKMYRTNRRRVTELGALVRTLELIPRYDYGSLLPAREDWAERWRTTRGKRILLFAKRDYSGSFYKWAAAINDHTEHAARLVVTAPHQYGYQLDLLIPNPNVMGSDWKDLWREADLLHLKDETGFIGSANHLPLEMLTSFEGPKVFTQYGGYARKHRDDPDYHQFVRSFEAVISMTPDLCFDWLGPNPIYVPHSIDCESSQFAWRDLPVIGHSPSTRARKGTEEFLEAVETLRNEYDLTLDLIEGVPHAEAVLRKRNLGLFFDQAGREMKSLGTEAVIGWYGNSALEAAVYGVPTIAHLSDIALAGAERAGVTTIRDIPIVNTDLGAEGIRRTIKSLLDMSSAEREGLAHETRRFVEDFHSQPAVSGKLSNIYESLV